MTICHYNGFKEEKMVQVNMTAFNLMRKGIELWPKYDFQNKILKNNYRPFKKHLIFFSNGSMVENAWNDITFPFNELIDYIGVRYNGGSYLEFHSLEIDQGI